MCQMVFSNFKTQYLCVCEAEACLQAIIAVT